MGTFNDDSLGCTKAMHGILYRVVGAVVSFEMARFELD